MADLLAHAERCGCPLDLVFGVYRGGQLVDATAVVESPGGAGLVLVPTQPGGESRARAVSVALDAVVRAAWQRSAKLLQFLSDPESTDLSLVLERTGFRCITRLLYLIRPDAGRSAGIRAARNPDWVQYSPAHHGLFEQALELSYAGSLDCPELAGLRSAADVLAGHRAAGVFDPSLWRVAMQGPSPVGILLLNRLPGRPALEIVYTGVAQASRGTGVADALLHHAVTLARINRARILALAVDCRNTPARRVYARWGFTQVMARDAWVASPCWTGS
ncbi:MAG: GNAT family N-acetyltransferase [Phycisphaerae bacterium]